MSGAETFVAALARGRGIVGGGVQGDGCGTGHSRDRSQGRGRQQRRETPAEAAAKIDAGHLRLLG